MSRTKLATLLAVSFLFGAGAGAWAAYEYYLRDGVRGMTALGDLSVLSLLEQNANLARMFGSETEYEAALKEYLARIDELEALRKPDDDVIGIGSSRINTLARLAILEEARGNSAQAQERMNSAVAACKGSKRHDCSEVAIRAVAEYLNRGLRSSSAASTK